MDEVHGIRDAVGADIVLLVRMALSTCRYWGVGVPG